MQMSTNTRFSYKKSPKLTRKQASNDQTEDHNLASCKLYIALTALGEHPNSMQPPAQLNTIQISYQHIRGMSNAIQDKSAAKYSIFLTVAT